METINDRFKLLRQACGKTQDEFAEIFGMSRSGICDIEKGRNNVTEKHLIMLSNWHERKVDIDWLRTGKGEMFIQLPEEDEVAAYVSDLLEDDGSNPLYIIIKEIMHTYNEISPKSQEVLREFSKKLLNNLNQTKES
ncbi:helix-turn-helix transcriptional regulator [Lachnospiraceae bacterium 50-23]